MADINRTDAAGLLQDQDINEILQDAVHSSVALQTFRRVNMGTKVARMPVLTALPTASFVTEASDATGVKPTSEMTWGDKTLTAEELAVIVPIHENVFEDSEFGIWEEVRPRVAEAFGSVLDGAVLFGTNKPASWATDLENGARAAGNVVDEGTGVDLAEDINLTWQEVEAGGHDVNIQYAQRKLRGRLRSLRDADNRPIYLSDLRGDRRADMIYGEDLVWVTNGAWVENADPDATPGTGDEVGATMIVGDRSKAILGIRSDMQVKLLTEATVGSLNLAERDMIALRFKFRVAFQVADPLMVETGTRSYPFAILTTAV